MQYVIAIYERDAEKRAEYLHGVKVIRKGGITHAELAHHPRREFAKRYGSRHQAELACLTAYRHFGGDYYFRICEFKPTTVPCHEKAL